MLKIIDIHTYYGDSYVLQGISLEVAKETVVALLWEWGGEDNSIDRSLDSHRLGEVNSCSRIGTSPTWLLQDSTCRSAWSLKAGESSHR